jgi:hypothetical protein
LYKYFKFNPDNKNRIYSQRDKFKNLIEEISEAITKIIYGLRFALADALLHSHVKGSRGTLNSDLCFSFHEENKFRLESHMHEDKNFMASYAENLLNKNFKYRHFNGSSQPYFFGESAIQFDFVNKCFSKFLPSLKHYSIKAIAGNINLPDLYFESSKGNTQKSPIYLVLKRGKNNFGFQDVGSGLSYVFPILTSLSAVQLSVIEQPELHLHPASQCELGDIFLAARHYGSIAIVESHSEHILLRIMRRIKETTNGFLLREELKVQEEDIRIYYFDPQSNGITNVKEIKLDKYGELLSTWPGGFFSEREKELFGE